LQKAKKKKEKKEGWEKGKKKKKETMEGEKDKRSSVGGEITETTKKRHLLNSKSYPKTARKKDRQGRVKNKIGTVREK